MRDLRPQLAQPFLEPLLEPVERGVDDLRLVLRTQLESRPAERSPRPSSTTNSNSRQTTTYTSDKPKDHLHRTGRRGYRLISRACPTAINETPTKLVHHHGRPTANHRPSALLHAALA